MQLVIIGAELLPFHLADGVGRQYVSVLCDFIDPRLELPQPLLHEECVGEGEDLEQAGALRGPHERDWSEVRELKSLDWLGSGTPNGRILVPHSN